MLPFELVATATDSPRYSPAGSLRKSGTDVKEISGTPVTVAFCWADADAATSSNAAAHAEARCRFMERSLYQAPRRFNEVSFRIHHRHRSDDPVGVGIRFGPKHLRPIVRDLGHIQVPS